MNKIKETIQINKLLHEQNPRLYSDMVVDNIQELVRIKKDYINGKIKKLDYDLKKDMLEGIIVNNMHFVSDEEKKQLENLLNTSWHNPIETGQTITEDPSMRVRIKNQIRERFGKITLIGREITLTKEEINHEIENILVARNLISEMEEETNSCVLILISFLADLDLNKCIKDDSCSKLIDFLQFFSNILAARVLMELIHTETHETDNITTGRRSTSTRRRSTSTRRRSTSTHRRSTNASRRSTSTRRRSTSTRRRSTNASRRSSGTSTDTRRRSSGTSTSTRRRSSVIRR